MIWRHIRRRLRDESGNATVEAVLWLPLFLLFLALVFDTSMTFFNQSQILRLTQDANRGVATGQIRSASEAEEFIRSGVQLLGANPTVSTVVAGNIVRSQVVVRAGDLGGVGLLGLIGNIELRIGSQHLLEG